MSTHHSHNQGHQPPLFLASARGSPLGDADRKKHVEKYYWAYLLNSFKLLPDF